MKAIEPSPDQALADQFRELAELRAELAGLLDGTVHLTEVDTGDDQYAIVLDSRPVTKQEAYEMYNGSPGGSS